MTKRELAKAAAAQCECSERVAEQVVDAAVKIMSQHLTQPGNEVTLRGFGTFSSRMTKERPGRNPATGAAIMLPAALRVKFKASKMLG